MQEIVISQTSSPDDPRFFPLSGCSVTVEDEKGGFYHFFESFDAGHYTGQIDGSKVIIGAKYRLSVTTPGGEQYKSSFEELLPSPPVDSVYFELQTKQTNDPENNLNGLQFYADFKADDTYGHYFRYELIETFEYHSRYPLQKWQDEYDHMHLLESPDYSNFVCYKTTKLRNIFVLSTNGLSNNSFPHFKLHFVKDHTPLLMIRYSLLVNQYSMDRKAYTYWETLRKNNQEATDLFGKQPAMIKGNIVNVNDSSDVALGYFGVSSIQRRRIMVNPIAQLSFDNASYCKAQKIFGAIPKKTRTYFAVDVDDEGNSYQGIAEPECVICQLMGGTTDKPSYWDEQ
jgi:hypothetical protein